MEWFLIAFFTYAAVGFLTCFLIARRSERKGKPPALFVLVSGPVGLVLSVILWPLIALIMWVEISFDHDEVQRSPEKEIIKKGVRGIVESEMKLVGKIRVGDEVVMGKSISGLIGIGEEIEIVGFEMNQYTVKRVNSATDGSASR